jgi:hypothetical protein
MKKEKGQAKINNVPILTVIMKSKKPSIAKLKTTK